MLNSSFSSLIFYINHFELADYIAFVWLIILLFLFLLLGVLLLRRHIILGIFVIFIVMVVAIVGPFVMKYYLNNSLRSTALTISNAKQLIFSDTYIIEGNITNLSKKDFSVCKVYIGFYKISKNKFAKYFDYIKPLKIYIHKLKQPLNKLQSSNFRIVLNEYKIPKDINISAVSECYK